DADDFYYETPYQQKAKITFTQFNGDCDFTIKITNTETPIKVPTAQKFIYNVVETDLGGTDPMLPEIKNIFKDIAVWSDVANEFVSMADLEEYDRLASDYVASLSTPLDTEPTYEQVKAYYDGLEDSVKYTYIDPAQTRLGFNADMTDYKVRVRFGMYGEVKFSQEVLENLVSLHSTDYSDIYNHFQNHGAKLTFNPECVQYGGSPCYEYTLAEEDYYLLNDEREILLSVVGNVVNDTESDNLPAETILDELGIYASEYGFVNEACSYVYEEYEVPFYITKIKVGSEEEKDFSLGDIKPLGEEVVLTIEPYAYMHVNFDNFDVYVGGIKGVRVDDGTDPNDVRYQVTIPANHRPSGYGAIIPNAYNYELSLSLNGSFFKNGLVEYTYEIITPNENFGYTCIEEESYESGYFARYETSKSSNSTVARVIGGPWSAGIVYSIPFALDHAVYDSISFKFNCLGMNFGTISVDFTTLNYTGVRYLVYEEGKTTYNLNTDTVSEYPTDKGYIQLNCLSGNVDFVEAVTYSETIPYSLFKLEFVSGTAGTLKLKGSANAFVNEQPSAVPFDFITFTISDGEGELVADNDGYYTLTRGVEYTVSFSYTIPSEFRQPGSSFGSGTWVYPLGEQGETLLLAQNFLYKDEAISYTVDGVVETQVQKLTLIDGAAVCGESTTYTIFDAVVYMYRIDAQ
ncbi:MAG: hypothetical protein IJY70_01655, partial [Clostridia bacterium]|nr:hypothetical protein [Clostridia bacterium]